MHSKKRQIIPAIILSAVFLLLTACITIQAPETEESMEIETETEIVDSPSSNVMLYQWGDEFEWDIIEIFEYKYYAEEGAILFWSNEEITDILFSRTKYDYDGSYSESHTFSYVPLLLPGQAIAINGVSPNWNAPIRISYTNSVGEYITTHILEEGDGYILSPTPALLQSDEPYTGIFQEFIPLGFRLYDYQFGDVNADGLEDALITIMSDCKPSDYVSRVIPMFILLGQPDGQYHLAYKAPMPLYYRNKKTFDYSIGEGYIDFYHYNTLEDYWDHVTQVNRFTYDSDLDDWILTGFAHNYTFLHDDKLLAPIPEFEGLSLRHFEEQYYVLDYSEYDFSTYDAVYQMQMPETAIAGVHSKHICVNFNQSEGCFEGYIFTECQVEYRNEYEEVIDYGSDFLFDTTFWGEYTTERTPEIEADNNTYSFTVGDYTWEYYFSYTDFFPLGLDDGTPRTIKKERTWYTDYASMLRNRISEEKEFILFDIDDDDNPELFISESDAGKYVTYNLYSERPDYLLIMGEISTLRNEGLWSDNNGGILGYSGGAGSGETFRYCVENGSLVDDGIVYGYYYDDEGNQIDWFRGADGSEVILTPETEDEFQELWGNLVKLECHEITQENILTLVYYG